MQVLMVGALPKWRGDGHLSSVESQLPYVFVNLDAHRQVLRGTETQVRAGVGGPGPPAPPPRGGRLPRAPHSDRAIPLSGDHPPGPVRAAPERHCRNSPFRRSPADPDRDNPLAENRRRGPPRTPSAHRPECATGHRPVRARSNTGLPRTVPQRAGQTRKFTWKNPGQLTIRRRHTGRGARPGTSQASSAPGPRHGE